MVQEAFAMMKNSALVETTVAPKLFSILWRKQKLKHRGVNDAIANVRWCLLIDWINWYSDQSWLWMVGSRREWLNIGGCGKAVLKVFGVWGVQRVDLWEVGLLGWGVSAGTSGLRWKGATCVNLLDLLEVSKRWLVSCLVAYGGLWRLIGWPFCIMCVFVWYAFPTIVH